jgi:hypothetical protein
MIVWWLVWDAVAWWAAIRYCRAVGFKVEIEVRRRGGS